MHGHPPLSGALDVPLEPLASSLFDDLVDPPGSRLGRPREPLPHQVCDPAQVELPQLTAIQVEKVQGQGVVVRRQKEEKGGLREVHVGKGV